MELASLGAQETPVGGGKEGVLWNQLSEKVPEEENSDHEGRRGAGALGTARTCRHLSSEEPLRPVRTQDETDSGRLQMEAQGREMQAAHCVCPEEEGSPLKTVEGPAALTYPSPAPQPSMAPQCQPDRPTFSPPAPQFVPQP